MTEMLEHIAFRGPAVARDEDQSATWERFAGLVERQSRFVFRVAYSVLRNSHDAEDVVQETFLKLYRTGAWTTIEDERAFLARAAWRMAVDRRPQASIDVTETDLPSSGHNPEQAAIAADWSATVHRLMDALPEELRQPLALSTVDELRSHQIAEVMGIPEGTVRSRLSRARQILKQKLSAFMAGTHER